MLRTLLRALLLSLASVAVLALVGAAVLGVWVYRTYMRDLPDIAALHDYTPSRVTRVFAAGGELVGSFYLERRIPVALAAVPERLRQAFLATEDARFYSHIGVDPQAITRAFWANVSEGHVAQGGSTITQQLAKVLLLSPERTLDRKIKEALLALRIEREFPKDQILEMYVNQIYFGSGAYGVASAAQTYFGKKLSELRLEEMAMLAGLPKAPTAFNPRHNPERAWQRRAVVLARMFDEHYITLTERRLAEAAPLRLAPEERSTGEVDHFLELVRRQLNEEFGSHAVYSEGLDVYTTLDLALQRTAFHAVRTGLIAYDQRHHYRGPIAHHGEAGYAAFQDAHRAAPPDGWGDLHGLVTAVRDDHIQIWVAGEEATIPFDTFHWAGRRPVDGGGSDPGVWQPARGPADVVTAGDEILVRRTTDGAGETRYRLAQVPEVEAALVCLRPEDGAILALVGGKDFEASEFNRAVQARRQPGSAFKPFIYGAAIDAGRSPATIYLDSPIIYDDIHLARKWRPANYSEKFYGPTPLREGLVQSRNVVTVRLLNDIGIRRAVRFAKGCGITSPLEADLSLALGASVVSPLEIASAYATFANGGQSVAPAAIRRVVSARGATLFEHTPAPRRAIAPATAYIVTDMLQDVVRRGTGRRVGQALAGWPIAGKTGTTNEYNDAWFIGFTPTLATAVWVGFDELRTLGKGETGAKAGAPIWIDFMRAALANQPRLPFGAPPEVRWRRVDRATGLLAAPDQVKNSRLECFLAGQEPVAVAPLAATGGLVQTGGKPDTPVPRMVPAL
ncbi:MAG TPA: PBP1A family penicillin-binding protein [bacterium]